MMLVINVFAEMQNCSDIGSYSVNYLLFTIKTFKIACLNWLTVYPINLLYSFTIFFARKQAQSFRKS